MNEALARIQKSLYAYPMLDDLAKRSSTRLPAFANAFLNGGTAYEYCLTRNRHSLDRIIFQPQFLRDVSLVDISTEIFGRKYKVPFGVSPLGMSDLIWPGTDNFLTQMAIRQHIPRVLSIFASNSIEEIGEKIEHGWFQIYPIRERKIRDHIIQRAQQSRYQTLVITVDTPTLGRRESMRRHGFTSPMPPFPTPKRILREALTSPAWSFQQFQNKIQYVSIFDEYVGQNKGIRQKMGFIREQFGCAMTWEDIKVIRNQWQGSLVLKGILHPDDARKARESGVDGLWLSNHGGRQLDDVPSPIQVLPEIKDVAGSAMKIMIDSGFRTGMDIIRAITLGADFVFLGRPFIHGISVLGDIGADVVAEILKEEMTNIMTMHGCAQTSELTHLQPYSTAWTKQQ